jgi:hypothetical protein
VAKTRNANFSQNRDNEIAKAVDRSYLTTEKQAEAEAEQLRQSESS